MIKIKYLTTAVLLGALFTSSVAFSAVKIRVQSVLPTKADEIVMVKDFAANVAALTNNEVQIEVLPDGAIVSGRDILDAVDKGLVEAGFAWTHYWSGKHQPRCYSARRWLELVLVSTTSPSYPGS